MVLNKLLFGATAALPDRGRIEHHQNLGLSVPCSTSFFYPTLSWSGRQFTHRSVVCCLLWFGHIAQSLRSVPIEAAWVEDAHDGR